MAGIVEFLGGPLFGLVGGIANKWMDLETQKVSNAHELKKFDFELQMRDKERIAKQEENEQNMQANQLDVEGQLVLADVKGSWQGLDTSIKADMAIESGYKWVSAVRALMRPALTVAGLTATTVMSFMMAGDIQTGAAMATYTNTSMMLAWWFGDRQTQKYQSRYLK